MFLDQLENTGRLETPHHDLFEAEESGSVRAPPSVGMKQRNGMQIDDGLGFAKQARHRDPMQIQSPVSQHDALRRSGAAARIKQLSDRVFIEAEDVGALGMTF